MNSAYSLNDPSAAYGNTGMQVQEGPGVKARLINLLTAVRTLMRSKLTFLDCRLHSIRSHGYAVPLIILNIVVIIYE